MLSWVFQQSWFKAIKSQWCELLSKDTKLLLTALLWARGKMSPRLSDKDNRFPGLDKRLYLSIRDSHWMLTNEKWQSLAQALSLSGLPSVSSLPFASMSPSSSHDTHRSSREGMLQYLYTKSVYGDMLVDLRFYTSKHSPGSSEADTGGPYINEVYSNATRAPLRQKTETKKYVSGTTYSAMMIESNRWLASKAPPCKGHCCQLVLWVRHREWMSFAYLSSWGSQTFPAPLASLCCGSTGPFLPLSLLSPSLKLPENSEGDAQKASVHAFLPPL